MKKNYIWLTGFVACAIVLSAANAFASTAASIIGGGSGAVTYDNTSGAYPVITAILSQPGSGDGYTYTTWSFLAADSTGSLDIYGYSGAVTPVVGDAILVTGTYSLYHQLPEIGSATITLESTGNSYAAPSGYTALQLTNSGTGTIPSSIMGHLVTLDDVTLYTNAAATILPVGNFPTHANVTLYAKDATGIIEVYVWASSYSTSGAFGGTGFPTGPVNITGFVTQSSGYPPEITPLSITEVPEPTTLTLCGAGALLLLALRFRRSV